MIELTYFLIAIVGFLAGAFLTSVTFIVASIKSQVEVKAEVKSINQKLNYWEKNGMPVCSFHVGIENRLRDIEIKNGG